MQKKTNYTIAVDSLSDARKDHYDGVHTIYRMAACVLFTKEETHNEIYDKLEGLLKELRVLDVRANRIMIHDNMIEIDFYPKRPLIVMNKGQYAGLMLEFASFLEESGIKNIFIQSGMYCDDPGDTIYTTNDYLVNHFPEFNSMCFGSCDCEDIEVFNLFRNSLEEEEVE